MENRAFLYFSTSRHLETYVRLPATSVQLAGLHPAISPPVTVIFFMHHVNDGHKGKNVFEITVFAHFRHINTWLNMVQLHSNFVQYNLINNLNVCGQTEENSEF